MISHADGKVINVFLWDLKDIYGDNLAENTGKIHEFLEMQFNFSFQDEVRINMTQYISKVIAEFLEERVGKSATPAADHFKV
jgi:hypothetical protein